MKVVHHHESMTIESSTRNVGKSMANEWQIKNGEKMKSTESPAVDAAVSCWKRHPINNSLMKSSSMYEHSDKLIKCRKVEWPHSSIMNQMFPIPVATSYLLNSVDWMCLIRTESRRNPVMTLKDSLRFAQEAIFEMSKDSAACFCFLFFLCFFFVFSLFFFVLFFLKKFYDS